MSVTRHPSELLHQVGTSMNRRHPEISVTVPRVTTWKATLSAVESALGEVDGTVIITDRRTESQRQILRQIALQNVKASSLSPADAPLGRPIRTQYDMESLPYPKPASEDVRKRLKESIAKMPYNPPDPYPLILHAAITERTLPIIKGNLTLRGIDSDTTDDPEEIFKSIDMLWDTGAQQTVITEDLLSETFRQYLKGPQHDPYRTEDGLRVQMDAVIGFSNAPSMLSAIVLIVPKTVVPNERAGILFGQQQCIDHMSYRSIPRSILEKKEEGIGEEIWGDIILDEYVDVDGDIHSL
ncbi:hypothetical protein GP486_008334 [Trichoglossum hirsutum]|uniref:Peptidase A2 domain-containing protein n=1 Tax=Trichoglossum hirsutum TaxID=265104 RepID=A0A9P8I4T2_9PEZI|nr:hypothetical protein GP486_008334 [Trichoglossum hirsutum]